jgi:hypothetical protein
VDAPDRSAVPRIVYLLAFAYWGDVAANSQGQPIFLGVPTALLAVFYLLPHIHSIGSHGITFVSIQRDDGRNLPHRR